MPIKKFIENFESACDSFECQFLTVLQHYEHIIWDWNGTLLDDLDIALETIEELGELYSVKPPGKEEYKAAFGFPVINYYRDLGFDFDKVSFEEMSEVFIKIYTKRAKKAQLHEGIQQVLESVSKDRTQSILSAASQSHLDEIVVHHGVSHHFDHVFGLENNYAVSKIDRGQQLIMASGVAPEKTLLVGDTDHDSEVGKALGVDVLLIADGHQSYERLANCHPHVLRSRYR